MNRVIRIGSRKSSLALIQSEEVKAAIEREARFRCEILTADTKGDRMLDRALPAMGDKGLFTKEFEERLLDGRIDIAVHSLKDLPTTLPEGLRLGAVTRRQDARDVLLSPHFKTLQEIPQHGCIATGSARRRAQVLRVRPDIVIRDLRGNVPTRIAKMAENDYDAIILAAAGIKRLGLEKSIASFFTIESMIPAAGQGALGIETRSAEPDLDPILELLHDRPSALETSAERTVLRLPDAGCQAPFGINASITRQRMRIVAFVSDMSGERFLHERIEGAVQDSERLALRLVERLVERGPAPSSTLSGRRGRILLHEWAS